MEKSVKSSLRAAQPGGAYSQGIAWGGLFITAGMGPTDPITGEVVGATIDVQTRRVLQSLHALLEDNGLSFNDVLKVTVHLQDLDRDFAGFDAVYREFFSPPYPVRTTVGSRLANILVEIDLMCANDRLADGNA